MPANDTPLQFEVRLAPGEKLSLPSSLLEGVGPGHWVVTISPAGANSDESIDVPGQVRDHSAFLNSYAPEDEGLYDDCAAR